MFTFSLELPFSKEEQPSFYVHQEELHCSVPVI